MTEPANSAPDRARPYWMPLLVLALGAGAGLLLLATNRIQQSLIAPDIGSLRAIGEIQTRITIAHLWIEEYVTGDEVDLQEIERSLQRAETLASALTRLDAGTNVPGASIDDTLEGRAARVFAATKRFGRLTRERRAASDAGADVGIGSAVDVRYDQVYGDLVTELDRFEQALVLRLSSSERRAAMLFRGLLIAWTLLVLLAATALWSRERRQRLTESALGDSQAKLLQAQKMEAVGRLAGGLAHDINNYLAAITAQSELVKMRAQPGGDTAKRMDAILATSARAGALIERLLAFSRRQPARPQAVDVNRILESLDQMLRQLLGADIRLSAETAPDLWPVEIDVSQLEQVILNLVVNAREAMTKGGALTLATRNVPGAPRQRAKIRTDRIALTVTDTGPGIPEALQRKIFEPFFTTKERTHSGLGLATVLGVVEQNGGRIDLRSGANGTTFEVLLPRSASEPVATNTEELAFGHTGSASEKILLVEDNDEVRRSTHDLLAGWGYQVTSAGLGRDAISRFATDESFDLLITDVVMPEMSGRQVAEALRARKPGLPVLFISGNLDDAVLRHGFRSGAIDLLPKPFSARQLAERVRTALERGDADSKRPDGGLSPG